MRILQVITLCDLGGAQSVVVNLANRLVKEHEVIVAAGAGDGKMWLLLHPSVICERFHRYEELCLYSMKSRQFELCGNFIKSITQI